MHYSICIVIFLIPSTICYTAVDYNIRETITPKWEFVHDLFKDNFVHDRDLGASIAIYHQGKLVLELWGGWFDQ
jgi:hypothetical protein